nr:MAG TPA: hypothetical protein [Caudoviricetes sp.]
MIPSLSPRMYYSRFLNFSFPFTNRTCVRIMILR